MTQHILVPLDSDELSTRILSVVRGLVVPPEGKTDEIPGSISLLRVVDSSGESRETDCHQARLERLQGALQRGGGVQPEAERKVLPIVWCDKAICPASGVFALLGHPNGPFRFHCLR